MSKHYNRIIHGLFVGNIRAYRENETNGVFDMIVNCTKNIAFPTDPNPNTKYVRIPVDDEPCNSDKLYMILSNTNILTDIHDCIQRGGTVLIHCHMGSQRSATVAACYLMKYKNFSYKEAIIYVKQKREIAFFCGVNFLDTMKLFEIRHGSTTRGTDLSCVII
jgi:Dual specificity phosphatase, catalytic domain